jgi:Hg(II)-responsive transcriptional regulator
MAAGLRSGEVAARAGVNVETLRYYERRGLLREPPRRTSGYRAYPPDTVRLIRFIKRAQELGFSLHEVEELLTLRDSRRGSCSRVRAAAQEKMADIDSRLAQLRAMRSALETLVATCGEPASQRRCPLLESLEDFPGLAPAPAGASGEEAP